MIKRLIVQTLKSYGYEVHRIPKPLPPAPTVIPPFDRVHYACGRTIMKDWLNVDIISEGPENYAYVDLTGRHPFPDGSFSYALCEDFVEHVDQAAALMFLVEVHRTLKKGGVLRLATPSLEAVLTRHYTSSSFDDYQAGRNEAYAGLGHVHFFSKSSMQLIAEHIGFEVTFVESGVSKHPALSGVNTRFDAVNLHAELMKR